MSFASRITRLPRPYEPELGEEARAAAPWASGDVATLLAGAGGSSPYLKGLIGKESAWLEGALADPEVALPALFDALEDTPADKLDNALRQGKRRVALLTGLADLAGVWPLAEVTGALTQFADLAARLALEAAIAREIRRGKLPGATEEDIAIAGGMVVLAMGKMGAFELNYSSDIDLICLFDQDRFERDDFHEARSAFVRATRKMSATLSDLTGEGYVFRTDLRLRPDPAVTPVCIAMEAAERYYESLGRAWERAAYIKARPCAGDIAAGERFLDTLRPFVWRRHLDFAAIQDAHDMRLRYRDKKGHGPITLPGHDMKLGRGGIREIEFFTQTRQIIAGGRDPDLRVRGTVDGLRVLSEKGWVPFDVTERLTDHYRAHREVEHRVQMVNDAQTHLLPGSGDGFDRLAALMGRDRAELEHDLKARLEEVHELTEGFFAPDARDGRKCEVPDELERSELLARWTSYPALRSGRAMEIFSRLRPEILSRLARAAKPQEALAAFDGFLAGLPAGVQLFSLFDANPQLIDLLVDIVSTSPDLARHLSRHSSVFDAVIGGDFFSPWPGAAALTAELGEILAREGDYERRLDMARRWAKEWHFRAGVHLLRGLSEPEEAGQCYADLAEAALAAVLPVVQEEFARKHGPAPGRGAVVVGMGSLGARRLHALSDLDLIVIYDPAGVEASEGRRPLQSRQYYARLTQALITAMTAPMAEGKLYEVDMRLRPSGNQGPVATSLASFTEYQRKQAWVWEHLALTRARVVAGPVELAEEVEALRAGILAAPPPRAKVLGELAEMRARIAAAKGQGDPWDPKLGRGRMQDIELLAQAGALLSGRAPRRTARGLAAAARDGWLEKAEADHLAATYRLCWSLQIGARLITEGALDPEELGAGGCAFLTRLTGTQAAAEMQEKLDDMTRRAAGIIDAALPREAET
ncbi:bifunctional [glutamate--ammonia ligase]-adenylyl-L-tyrosine phosphorylase/[glutamate--ammonia-ligase] adenylyltransferase [Salipiger sp. P9]|uniref:bifunctional [glutamate--ammonia ligase]-adenylyl-L-tyrosine phosphorylase/[glutamate--ammonia-ligase] adenylyltransferase n=1 Tax=Salipiger pentaromativorans TaxID=2943193 RepID=UPI0021582B1C|nr:bifunctional [glutamate--ammonia ligase]-adenylyl-L-tyrosine phosphorylase/[glutamate--ammonia-ligase] adenylyltransferase [Salipiger pentaromativorans]MCR8546998.1 bifunctional [glutamate--ammonia ligase]-adenylyl-L-tyrosine phosphorylase/[glutamate--ammonia-ligase] adenylyltransferase [Salipiger pentaromativorans]